MKWEKWIIDEDIISNDEKAIICGHYIFSNKEFLELKLEADFELNRKGINLDNTLKNHVKNIIRRYLVSFRLI